MKKIIIMALLMVVFVAAEVFADYADDEIFFEKMHTGGARNGLFILQEDPIFAVRQIEYINGVRESFARSGVLSIEQNFPDQTSGEILDALKSYYRNNPGMERRPVIEVMFSGCRPEDRFNVITPKMETSEYLNGFYLLSGEVIPLARRMYVQGVCDAVTKLDMRTMVKYYGEMDYPDIWSALHTYYKEHPFEKEKSIVDVILSGMGGKAKNEKRKAKNLT